MQSIRPNNPFPPHFLLDSVDSSGLQMPRLGCFMAMPFCKSLDDTDIASWEGLKDLRSDSKDS